MELSFNLNEELAKYFDASSICRDGEPNFALFMGGVGAGKTTVRHQKCGKDYVHLDAAEIFANFAKGKTYEFPTAFEEPLELMGSLIAKQAIKQKRNIAMEVIGNSLDDTRALIDAMKSVGYKVHLANIQCDPVESYKRHINAVQTDTDYVSAFHTQRFHYKWILDAVKELQSPKDHGAPAIQPKETMKEGFKPDYGLYCFKTMPNVAEHVFANFTIFNLYRIESELYSATSTMTFNKQEYAITVDFPEPMYRKMLTVLPDQNVAKMITNAFSKRFINPQRIDFDVPLCIGVKVRPTEIVANENEQYVPFMAVDVF